MKINVVCYKQVNNEVAILRVYYSSEYHVRMYVCVQIIEVKVQIK